MTREEILPIAKPILFNTEMVWAILDNRKKATRRIAKSIIPFDDKCEYFNVFRRGEWTGPLTKEQIIEEYAPCHVGDTLYVRETWSTRQSNACMGNTTTGCPYDSCETASGPCFEDEYIYKATDSLDHCGSRIRKWNPSIHMPKAAARIFLRVTDVRFERLQDMDTTNDEHFFAEGAKDKHDFIRIWNDTVGLAKRELYGWYANPWVWVIEFERAEV